MDVSAKRVSRLGLGCSRVGSFNNPASMAAIRETLALALDLGVTVFDTADIYGQGDSERELGRLLRRRRDEAFVVTKVGKLFSRKMRLLRPFKPLIKPLVRAARAGAAVAGAREGGMRSDFTPARLAPALEASLRRLAFDHVDALLLHSPDERELSAGGLAEALEAIKASGKARRVGISCDDAPALRAALALPVLDLLELPVDLIEAAREGGLTARFAERGVIVLAREVIRLQPALAPMEAVAKAAARADVDCVILGVSRREHLVEAVAACGRGIEARHEQVARDG